MKVIMITILILFLTSIANAGLTINTLWKYGVNGYSESGVSQSSSQSSSIKTKKTTTSTSSSSSVDTLNVDNRYQITPGIGFEVSPQYDGVVLGAGYYFDNTVQMNLGWKLF